MNRDPSKRLGSNGPDEIKRHAFFAEISWTKLLNKKYIPPFKPDVASATDTSNFDEEFTSEVPMDSVSVDSHLSETVQQQFAGFSYAAGAEHMNQSYRAGGGSGGASGGGVDNLTDKTRNMNIGSSYQKVSVRGVNLR